MKNFKGELKLNKEMDSSTVEKLNNSKNTIGIEHHWELKDSKTLLWEGVEMFRGNAALSLGSMYTTILTPLGYKLKGLVNGVTADGEEWTYKVESGSLDFK